MTDHGRSFRIAGHGDGPQRSVIGPGVLAASFALLLTLAGTPAHLGVVAPGVVASPTAAAAQVHPAPQHSRPVHPPARAKRPSVARSVLLREDCHH